MMRLSILVLSLAAACAVAVPAVVNSQQTQSSPTASAVQADNQARAALSQVEVRARAPRHRLDSDEARHVAGTYAMSNGWTVRVIPRRDHVLLAINDGEPIQLFAQSADKFASADGNVATVFNLGPAQEDVVMSYVPEGALADERVVIGSAVLAAR